MPKLLNKKYLGFLEWILHEITEFIELACGPNLKGEVSAQKKQWIANLMAESAPLVYQHSLVGKASTLGKMLKYGMAPPSAEEVRKGSVVYARWNLTNDVTYVGETGKWEQRVGQHYMKTRSHEMGSDKPCSGCAEHAKYLKHRPVSAACWFMTPVRVCSEGRKAASRKKHNHTETPGSEPRQAAMHPSDSFYAHYVHPRPEGIDSHVPPRSKALARPRGARALRRLVVHCPWRQWSAMCA